MAGDESGTPEPRRSGRSTKGQHTRNAELNEEPPVVKKTTPAPPTKKGGRTTANTRSKAANADKSATSPTETATTDDNSEDGEIIRCVCGADTDEGGRQMIQCDICNAWQHSSCMQIPTKNTPEEYYCEQCRPELHKELLDRMAKGERPWERRGGRKGSRKSVGGSKKKRGSEAPDTPAPEGQNDADGKDDNDARMESPTFTATSGLEKEERGTEERDTEEPDAHETVVQNLDEVVDPALKSEPAPDVEMFETPEAPPEMTAPSDTGRRRSSVASPTATLKRKAEESVEDESADGKKPKTADNQLEQVAAIEELKSDTRRKGAETLKKFLENSLKLVEKLPEGETTKAEFAARLALEIEHHTYILLSAQTAGEPNDEYRLKFRSILFNLKKNEPLLNNLLSKKLGTKEFSDMTGDEMATEDMKHIVQEAEKESEKQSIMTSEAAGPRIRRTHKGEEIVGEDTEMIAENSTGFIGSRYEAPAEGSEHGDSPPPSPGADDDVMADRPRSPSPGTLEPADTPSKALKIDTSKHPAPGHHRRTSSFDIQSVWSNVESTDVEKGHRQSIPRPPITPLTAHPANGGNTQLDRDIDMLLQNDGTSPGGGSETPPYSPKDYMDEAEEEGVIWKGKVLMRGVAELEAQAVHVVGPDLSSKVPWATVIGSSIEITGRISVDRANEYLHQLRYSSRSSDVVVFTLHPSASRANNSLGQAGFDKLFSHFKERQRSGVVGNVTWSPTKDVYVVAVGKDEPMPKHMLNTQFQAHPREKDALLLSIVFNRSLEPFQDGHTPTTASAGYTPVPPSRAVQTPVTVQPPQQQWQAPPMNAGYAGYQQSPTPVGNYQPDAHRSPIGAPQSNSSVVDGLMQVLQLGPADQAMLNEIVERNPQCASNPEQLMRLVQQYQYEHGRRT
ncbi:hypothetical protein ABW21_db0207041 [Orbilia brochopaga]|nr:hypothetical protein ABW21_db0207041 [Drechslerella brochopaga]